MYFLYLHLATLLIQVPRNQGAHGQTIDYVCRSQNLEVLSVKEEEHHALECLCIIATNV